MILLVALFVAFGPNPPRLAVTAIDGVSQTCEVIGETSCPLLWCNCAVVVPAN